MKRTLMSIAVAAAMLGLCTAAQAGTVNVNIAPDAGANDGTISVGSLDWNVGNSIAVADGGQNLNAPAVGQQLTVYAHASLGNFLDGDGNAIGGLHLNGAVAATNYEWTFVSSFREVIANISGATVTTAVVANPNNVFQVYYDPTPDANNLTGGGFNGANDGILILEAKGGSGVGNFTAQTNAAGAVQTGVLDNFGGQNYAGYNTELGQGSTTINGTVDFFNSSFFPDLTIGDVITLLFTTQQVLNYNQQNPSSCFWNPTTSTYFVGAGNGIATAPCQSAVGDGGTIGMNGNGIPGTAGPNQMFQTDASTSFLVPEPGSLVMLATALLGVYGVTRRKSA